MVFVYLQQKKVLGYFVINLFKNVLQCIKIPLQPNHGHGIAGILHEI